MTHTDRQTDIRTDNLRIIPRYFSDFSRGEKMKNFVLLVIKPFKRMKFSLILCIKHQKSKRMCVYAQYILHSFNIIFTFSI